jgi:hypothetical protein
MALKTPEGVVRICCTGLLFSLPGSARKTHGIQNTPEGVFLHQAVQGTHTTFKIHQWVVKNCFTLVCCFFTGQCNEQTRHSKHTRGCCKIILPWSAVSLPGSSRNTHSIQNSPEGD